MIQSDSNRHNAHYLAHNHPIYIPSVIVKNLHFAEALLLLGPHFGSPAIVGSVKSHRWWVTPGRRVTREGAQEHEGLEVGKVRSQDERLQTSGISKTWVFGTLDGPIHDDKDIDFHQPKMGRSSYPKWVSCKANWFPSGNNIPNTRVTKPTRRKVLHLYWRQNQYGGINRCVWTKKLWGTLFLGKDHIFQSSNKHGWKRGECGYTIYPGTGWRNGSRLDIWFRNNYGISGSKIYYIPKFQDIQEPYMPISRFWMVLVCFMGSSAQESLEPAYGLQKSRQSKIPVSSGNSSQSQMYLCKHIYW